VRYRYAQQRSPEWFVRVEFNPATAITQE
jgi:hypothetical protein